MKTNNKQLVEAQKKQLEIISHTFISSGLAKELEPEIKKALEEEQQEKDKAKENKDQKETTKNTKNKQQQPPKELKIPEDKKIETIKKVTEEQKKAEEANRKHMVTLLDNKLQYETQYLKAIEAVLTQQQRSRMALTTDPSLLTKMKNMFLGLEGGNFEYIMEKVSKISLLPNLEKARGK